MSAEGGLGDVPCSGGWGVWVRGCMAMYEDWMGGVMGENRCSQRRSGSGREWMG
jgi:hypothetical protein